MKVITAPEEYTPQENEITCFLAGGIKGCNWQNRVIEILNDLKLEDLVIFNPRREYYPNNNSELIPQTEWEFKNLNNTDIFSIYFCSYFSVQPISFYELGRNLVTMKYRFPKSYLDRIIVSVNRRYQRSADVIIQTKLVLDLSIAQYRDEKSHAMEIAEAYWKIKLQNKR